MNTDPPSDRSTPAFPGLILASGMSTRFGGKNKLLLPVDGIPIVRRTVSAYLEAQLSPVLVVVGYDASSVTACIADLPIEIIRNPDFSGGQSTSLVRGVQNLPLDACAAIIGVADQPFLTPHVIRLLIERYLSRHALIIAPTYRGSRGNPVLFDRSLFSELALVTGDQGGRGVIQAHQSDLLLVEIGDLIAGRDVDTPEDVSRLMD
ncbi:MAG: nucleotidyltransferase family protein [Chloroflexota bacterium]